MTPAPGPARIPGMGRELRIRAVVFDAMGTLLRLREPVGATYGRLAAAHGVELPSSRIEEAFGRVFAATRPDPKPGEPAWQAAARERARWREIVRQTFRAADGTARFADFDAFFDALWRHYAQAGAWQLMPGALEALDALAASGRELAILSNFDQRLRGILEGLGIHDRFRAVTLPADAGAAKPDRQIFHVCLKRLGLAGPQVVYVGDHAVQDVKASRAAGLRAIDVGGLATLAELPPQVEALEEAP